MPIDLVASTDKISRNGRVLFRIALLMMFSGVYDGLTIADVKQRLFDGADKNAVDEFGKILTQHSSEQGERI